MNERELKCIRQRIAVSIDNHQDAIALVAEVAALRTALIYVRDMTGDPAIICTINDVLGES